MSRRTSPEPFQFHLRTLLIAVLLMSIVCGLSLISIAWAILILGASVGFLCQVERGMLSALRGTILGALVGFIFLLTYTILWVVWQLTHP